MGVIYSDSIRIELSFFLIEKIDRALLARQGRLENQAQKISELKNQKSKFKIFCFIICLIILGTKQRLAFSDFDNIKKYFFDKTSKKSQKSAFCPEKMVITFLRDDLSKKSSRCFVYLDLPVILATLEFFYLIFF